MAKWTTEQVGQWLTKVGLESLVKPFKDARIDGESLLTLTVDTLAQILSARGDNEKQNKAISEKFKIKLQEWKLEYSVAMNSRRSERRGSASRVSSATTNTNVSAVNVTDQNTDAAYTKTLTISPDNTRVSVEFFKNSLFCAKLQKYLFQTYNIKCSIGMERQDIIMTLAGEKQHVKSSCDGVKSLFESIQTKIFNSEVADRKAVYWSKYIFSDMAINVIQQIMNNEKLFTVWDKTEALSGYYKVMYFTLKPFEVSEVDINQILNREIAFIDDIKMPNEKTKSSLKEIEQFVVHKRQPELAIIYCKYPYQTEIKISVFGRKKLVKIVDKQLRLLIDKYTLKPFTIKMTSIQHEYLVDNCLQQLKDIESEYKDDNVQIHIRQKEFHAPQYLIEKIKQQINELISQTVAFVIQKIGNTTSLTDEENVALNQIAKQHNCRIESVESKHEMQVYSIPKALAETIFASMLIVEQSKAFCATSSVRKLSVLNGSIEVYTADQSRSVMRDVTVVSTEAGAVEERIGSVHNNGFFESSSGRKIVFLRWSPIIAEEDQTNTKLKKSVVKFISLLAQTIATNCPDAETIVISTSEWENFRAGQQLAEELIIEMKREIEMRRSSWRVLFIFNNQQSQLSKEFHQTMIRLQPNENGFSQFACLVLTIRITLITSKGNNLSLCENEMNSYIQKYISTTKTVKNLSDLGKWDQHMINAFYKYCRDKSILPKIDLTTYQLQLTGSTQDVEKAMRKYQLMSEILTLKSSARIPPPVAPRSSIAAKNRPSAVSNGGYNIMFSHCPQDQAVCHQLITSLVSEGYSICQTSSNLTVSQQQIEKSDLMLIYFNENYPKDTHCMAEFNYAKSKGKKIIPIVVTNTLLDNTEESFWLCSITIIQLHYEFFDAEIEVEFTGDFDLDYDKLLVVLLRYTKPGVTGQFYPQAQMTSETVKIDTDYEQDAFGYTSMALQKVTEAQRKEREKVYWQQSKKQIQNEKIPSDEIKTLIASLTLVTDDLKGILKGENPYIDMDPQDEDYRHRWRYNYIVYSPVFVEEFLNCAKRWLSKAPNVIKKNVAPFTPTGDINDAVFQIHQPTNADWWRKDYEQFRNLPPEDYFNVSELHENQGSWFTDAQAHDCFQHLIKINGRTNLMETKIDENDTAWDTVSISEMDNKKAAGDEDEIDDRWKTPEEIQKIQELDNPNRIWKRKKQVTEEFMKQKLRNILEFQQLCDKTKES